MTDKSNGAANKTLGDTQVIGEATSFVGMVFTEPGSSEGILAEQNVTPSQMLLAGEFLLTVAKRKLNDLWTQRQLERAKEQGGGKPQLATLH